MVHHPLLPKERIRASDFGLNTQALPPNATLVLCEDKEDVNRLKVDARLGKQVDAVVALTPEAACQCIKDERDYYKLEDFFDEGLFCTASEPILAQQEEWAKKLDEFLLESVPQFRGLDFRPASLYFLQLKVVIDELFMCAFSLVALLVASRPCKVIYFGADRTDPISSDLYFRQSVYSLVLPACAQLYGVSLLRLEPSPQQASQSRRFQRRNTLRSILGEMLSPGQRQILRELRTLGVSECVRRRLGRLNSPGLLIFKYGYDVALVADVARNRGWQCKTFSDLLEEVEHVVPTHDPLADSMSALWDQVTDTPFFRQSFQWLGVDLWHVAKSHVHHWWHQVIPLMWHTLIKVREQFSRQSPSVVLVWSPHNPEDYSILHAARSLGIPTVTYQHGGFEGNCEYGVLKMTDLNVADCRLVYGAGVERYFRGQIPDGRSRLVSVGSARLDSLRDRLGASQGSALRSRLGVKMSQALVLYVPTLYPRQHRYMCCGDLGNVPYFELQTQVVKLMCQFPDIHFIYKPFGSLLRHSPDPIIEMISMNCPNCQVIYDLSLPELFWASDVHVIDIPSTGLLEALLTPKPILVFSDKHYLRPPKCGAKYMMVGQQMSGGLIYSLSDGLPKR